MQDRTIKYGLEADARRFVSGVKEAERALEAAKSRAKALTADQQALEARAAQLTAMIQRKISADEVTEVVKRRQLNRKLVDDNVAAQQKAAKDIAAAQKNLTREIERESKKQAAAQQAGIRGALSGGARAAMQGTGVPLPFGAGGVAAIGGAIAGAAAATLIRKAIQDNLELAQSIRQVAIESQAGVPQVSALLAVTNRLGIDSSAVSSALNSLRSAVASNPEQFQALGIALTNADGSARPLFEILMDVRRVLSESKNDLSTAQLATELLGGAWRDLIPLLGLSEDELRVLQDALVRTGQTMSQEAVDGALKYQDALNGLGFSMGQLVQRIGQSLIPALAAFVESAQQTMDFAGELYRQRDDQFFKDVPVLGGVEAAIRNRGDSDFNQRVKQAVKAGSEARAKLAELAAKTTVFKPDGTDQSGNTRSALADSTRASSDAIRDQIDAIKEEARARQDALRESLDAFQKEHDAAIRTIQDEQDARQAAHEKQIRAIEDEQRTLEAAYTVRERARSDEIDSLREQIRAEQEVIDLEQARANIADAERDAALERTVVVGREQFATLTDYYRATADQRKRIADADRRVTDAKKALARDEAKVQIEERIRAIQAAADADKRALEDYKANSQDRLRAIRDEMALEKNQADKRIQQLRDEQAAVRDRMGMIIDAIQKETDAVVKGLEAQLKAAQGLGAALDYAARPRTVTITTVNQGVAAPPQVSPPPSGVGPGSDEPPGGAPNDILTAANAEAFIRQAYRDILGRELNANEAPGAWLGRIGRSLASILSEIFNSAEAKAYRGHHFINPNPGMPGGGGGSGVHDYPHTLTFARPTLMVDMASGAAIGAAAVSGPEPVTFHGVGATRSGGGGDGPLSLNVYGLTVHDAAIVVAREVGEMRARRARRGWVRK